MMLMLPNQQCRSFDQAKTMKGTPPRTYSSIGDFGRLRPKKAAKPLLGTHKIRHYNDILNDFVDNLIGSGTFGWLPFTLKGRSHRDRMQSFQAADCCKALKRTQRRTLEDVRSRLATMCHNTGATTLRGLSRWRQRRSKWSTVHIQNANNNFTGDESGGEDVITTTTPQHPARRIPMQLLVSGGGMALPHPHTHITQEQEQQKYQQKHTRVHSN